LIYFVTQRMPVSRWHHYDPGVQSSENIQREIISEIEKNNALLIIRESIWDNMREPNKSAVSSKVIVLDLYLEKYFHKEISFGKLAVYNKN
jgi:hypothetical protein